MKNKKIIKCPGQTVKGKCHIYIYSYVCGYVYCTCVCMNACMCRWAQICVFAHIYIYISECVYVHMCMHVCACMQTRSYIYPVQGAVSIRKTVLLGMAIPMLKIRRPTGRLIFNMGIPIPGKTVFLIETGPWWCFLRYKALQIMHIHKQGCIWH